MFGRGLALVLVALLCVDIVAHAVTLWHTRRVLHEVDTIKATAASAVSALSVAKTAAVGGVVDRALLVKDGALGAYERLRSRFAFTGTRNDET